MNSFIAGMRRIVGVSLGIMNLLGFNETKTESNIVYVRYLTKKPKIPNINDI